MDGGSNWSQYSDRRYDVENISYDKNGNILSLDRYGLIQVEDPSTPGQQLQAFGLMDKLTYSYDASNPNRLVRVDDAQDVSAGSKTGLAGDFSDWDGSSLVKNTTEYNYDVNGNLVSDDNKGIVDIKYNHLNLPRLITFSGNREIEYTYDAAGIKLRKVVRQQVNGVFAEISRTDYVGGMVYEADVLEFMHSAEGRILAPNALPEGSSSADFVYEYHIKDHLGNLRVAFREPGDPLEYLATMDDPNDEMEFRNVSRTRDPGWAKSPTFSAKLDASNPLGPWKSLRVSKGDEVDMEVYAHFKTEDEEESGFGGLNLFLSSNPNYSEQFDENGNPMSTGFSLQNLQLGIGISPALANPNADAPQAYLKYIFFDLENNYISDGIVFISALAKNNVTGEKLSLNDFIADQDGYLQVFVAYESGKPVWFDDLKITHQPALVVQENHYYPFGLNITTLEKQGVPEHKFQFMGVEKEDSFGLNWTETEWRGYDAQIGRFHQIDNLSEKYYDWSPYHYAGNDPITITDPTGEDWYVRVSIKPKYDSEGNFAGATFESSVLWADTHADEYVASDGLTYYKAQSDGGLMVETSAYEDKGGYIYYDRDGNAEYGNRIEERNAAREAEGPSPGTIEHYPIIQEAIEWMMGLGEMKAGAKILKEVVSEGVEMSIKKKGPKDLVKDVIANPSKFEGPKKKGRRNVTKVFSTRKKAKDARPKPSPTKKGGKRITRQKKNKKGEGRQMKTDGNQTPHFHDVNHNDRNKDNIHYRLTKKIRK